MINIVLRAALLGMFWITSGVASAGTISANTWYQFSFANVGAFATGCDPADPAGQLCSPSGGTPTQFASAPPWTFTVGALGARLKVIDAFTAGDRFEVFSSGNSLGATSSAPDQNIDCGDDPEVCLVTTGMSYGEFVFGAGNYSLAISVLDTPTGVGSAYFQVTSNVNAVPTPGTFALMLFGLFALWLVQSKRRLVASNVGG